MDEKNYYKILYRGNILGILEQKKKCDCIGSEAKENAWLNGVKFVKIQSPDIEIYTGYRRVYARDVNKFLNKKGIYPY